MENFDINKIQQTLGYTFKDPTLLENAFIHSSYTNEHRKVKSNERLEFLGDSVLSVIVTDEIYHKYKKSEGDLSKIRASLVSEKSLSFVFSQLDLAKYIKCGVGLSHTTPTPAMQADAMEAIIAAIYLDAGIERARTFVLNLLSEALKEISKDGVPDSHKSMLQEKFKTAKIYYQTTASGEGQDKVYTSRVFINGAMSGIGVAGKKRVAEDLSAFEALKALKKI